MSLKEFLVLLMICTVWGLHFIVIKLAVGESIPPVFYAATRVTLVATLTLPWLRWHKGQMLWVILGGLGFSGFNYLFIFQGLEMTTATAGVITIELYVPFSILLSVIFFKEKVGLWRAFGVAMAFCGVVIVATARPGEAAGPYYFQGILFLMCAAMSEAIGALMVKKVKDVRPLELLSWFTLVGACLLWPASLLIEDNQLRVFSAEIRWNFMGAVLYSALLASILAHGSYYWLLKRLPLHTVAPSGLMMTIVTVAAAVVILKEPLTPRLMAGAFLTLSGIAIILIRNRKRAESRIITPQNPA